MRAPHPVSCLPTTLLAALLIGTPVHAEKRGAATAPTHPITLEPSRLARLAALQSTAGPGERLDFASITLRVLRDSYARELERSYDEPASTAQRRRKLARWQAATRALIGTLDDALWKLSGGAELQIQVDRRQQVILLVDGRAYTVTGPNPPADRRIENDIVDDYCARYVCEFPDTVTPSHRDESFTGRGNWDLRQGRRPAFVVGTRLRCEFTSLDRRSDKSRACLEFGEELDTLGAAMRQAAVAGHRPDWDTVAAQGAPAGGEGPLVINERGAYLPLQLPLSSRIDARDWQRLVDWLRQSIARGESELVIANADRLLAH